MTDSADFMISAALLRRGEDAASLIKSLSDLLTRALPRQVTVKRSVWPGARRVKCLAVELDPGLYRLEAGHRGMTAWVDFVVRGVCIKSQQLPIDDWLDRLAHALSAEATRSVEARIALEQALR